MALRSYDTASHAEEVLEAPAGRLPTSPWEDYRRNNQPMANPQADGQEDYPRNDPAGANPQADSQEPQSIAQWDRAAQYAWRESSVQHRAVGSSSAYEPSSYEPSSAFSRASSWDSWGSPYEPNNAFSDDSSWDWDSWASGDAWDDENYVHAPWSWRAGPQTNRGGYYQIHTQEHSLQNRVVLRTSSNQPPFGAFPSTEERCAQEPARPPILEEVDEALLRKVFREKDESGFEAFICPITHSVTVDPVVAPDGHTYERAAITEWFTSSHKSPVTGLVLPSKVLVPNHAIRTMLKTLIDASGQQAHPEGRSAASGLLSSPALGGAASSADRSALQRPNSPSPAPGPSSAAAGAASASAPPAPPATTLQAAVACIASSSRPAPLPAPPSISAEMRMTQQNMIAEAHAARAEGVAPSTPALFLPTPAAAMLDVSRTNPQLPSEPPTALIDQSNAYLHAVEGRTVYFKGVTREVFNGRQYGDGYLCFYRNEKVHRLHHPEEKEGWAFGLRMCTGSKGWYPESFLVLSHPQLLKVTKAFDGTDYHGALSISEPGAIVEVTPSDTVEHGWIRVKHVFTGQKGWFPATHLEDDNVEDDAESGTIR